MGCGRRVGGWHNLWWWRGPEVKWKARRWHGDAWSGPVTRSSLLAPRLHLLCHASPQVRTDPLIRTPSPGLPRQAARAPPWLAACRDFSCPEHLLLRVHVLQTDRKLAAGCPFPASNPVTPTGKREVNLIFQVPFHIHSRAGLPGSGHPPGAPRHGESGTSHPMPACLRRRRRSAGGWTPQAQERGCSTGGPLLEGPRQRQHRG